jgi:hypothetical protein
VTTARLFWSAQVNSGVLPVDAEASSSAADSFDFARFASIASVAVSDGGRQHVALSDGFRRIRIDVESASVLQGPVRFHYRLSGLRELEGKLLALRRLAALCRLGRFARSLHPPEPRAPRWIEMLRAHDASAAGASQREIAEALFGERAARDEWRTGSDSLRLRIQRLVRSTRIMIAGGYLRLLP